MPARQRREAGRATYHGGTAPKGLVQALGDVRLRSKSGQLRVSRPGHADEMPTSRPAYHWVQRPWRPSGRIATERSDSAWSCAAVGWRSLRHRPGFDLADPLASETEADTDLLEGARLAPVEAEPQADDLPLAIVEARQHLGHFAGSKAAAAASNGDIAPRSSTRSPSSASLSWQNGSESEAGVDA